jgi:D-glycero-D-manno-heptose 1,7-bisphosphate phosphatase
MSLKAVLLDRDGVICVNRDDHVKNWSEFEFLPDAANQLQRLSTVGLRLAIVTNQAIIGRGMVSHRAVEKINTQMCERLRQSGVEIEGVFICPHAPDDECGCRKPAPGLVSKAIDRMAIEPDQSCIVGDVYSDIAAGFSGGCRSGFLVSSNRDQGRPDICVPEPWQRLTKVRSLGEAVSAILMEVDE